MHDSCILFSSKFYNLIAILFLCQQTIEFESFITNCDFVYHFFSSNILYSYLANTIFPRIEVFLLSQNIGEAYYFSNADVFLTEKVKGGFGIASIIALISDFLIILNSNKLKSQYKINIEYNLYLIGVIFFYIQNLSITIYRLNLYFTTFKFIMLGYLLFEFIKCKKYVLSVFLMVVYIAWYVNGIFRGANMAPYTFIGE